MPLAIKIPIGGEVKSRLHGVRSLWLVNEGNTPQLFSSLRIASPSTWSSGKNPAVILNFALFFTIQSCLQKKPNLSTSNSAWRATIVSVLVIKTGSLLPYYPITCSHRSHSSLSKPVNQIISLFLVRPFPVIPSHFFKKLLISYPAILHNLYCLFT